MLCVFFFFPSCVQRKRFLVSSFESFCHKSDTYDDNYKFSLSSEPNPSFAVDILSHLAADSKGGGCVPHAASRK